MNNKMSLCDNQDKFNKAFYDALKDSRKKDTKTSTPAIYVYIVLHTIFLIWGVMLAFKQPREQRVVHITMSMVFSPAYVMAYYLNMF